MQSDVTQIKRNGEFVTLPLSLYEELRAFCRQHGESDLPGFAEFIPVLNDENENDFVTAGYGSGAPGDPTKPKLRKPRGEVGSVIE